MIPPGSIHTHTHIHTDTDSEFCGSSGDQFLVAKESQNFSILT